MQTALVILIVSGSVLGGLLLLFSYENGREKRVLAPLRRFGDAVVIRFGRLSATINRSLFSGKLWWYTQKATQHFVAFCVGIVRSLEYFFDGLQRKQLNKAHLRNSGLGDEHLQAMSAHKKEVSLSPDERARLRAERLEE